MYTRILQLFLARGTAFDWYSLSRPTVPTATTKGSKLLELTERVMTLALDARFLEVLKGVETSLSGSGTSVMKTSASSARLASSPRIGIEGYKYRNVSNIRNGIVTWEDTFVYTPVFEEGKVGGVQGRFVGAVWEGRERLLQWKEKKIEEEEENTGSYFGWGKEKKNTQDQYSVIDKTLKKLEAIVDRVTKVWELPNPALAVPLRRSMSDITGGIDDEGIVKEWAPGVAEPQRSGNVLTLRGRNQVKMGLRKSTGDSVGVMASGRASRLLKETEIEFLVWLLGHIANFIDRQYAKIREEYSWMPKLNAQGIRWFAAYEHLVGTLVLVFLIRMIL